MTEKYEELNDTDFLSIESDSNPMIKSVEEKVSTFRVFLSAQLWFQFIDYVGMGKDFVRTE